MSATTIDIVPGGVVLATARPDDGYCFGAALAPADCDDATLAAWATVLRRERAAADAAFATALAEIAAETAARTFAGDLLGRAAA